MRITAKLGNMRKAAEWTVYPVSRNGTDETITIQSDHRIAQFYKSTGNGLISVHKTNGAYFLHLSQMLGAKRITVPADVIAAASAAQPKSGDSIGPGVTIA